jgi:hypothetical protein
MECAIKFRERYPNYSFTTIGYSVSPIQLNEEYQQLVDIKYESGYRGDIEIHTCKCCKEEVYNKEHT